MGVIITGDDLRSALPSMSVSDRDGVADDAEALAAAYCPCLFDVSFNPLLAENAGKVAQFKAIVRRAVTYDAESGSGAVTTRSVNAGPFGSSEQIDTRQKQAGMLFSPAQIDALRALCGPKRRAVGVSMVPSW